MTTYHVWIDTADDGQPTASGDISADVVALEWRLGMARAYDDISAPATARVTVRNWDGAHSPERGTLQRGQFLRITSADGATERTHFSGFIERIEPTAGEHGERLAQIIVHGADAGLRAGSVSLPPLLNATADAVIDAVLSACRWRLYPSAPYCLIDVDGRATIDASTVYGEDGIERDLQGGKSHFAYVGDTWRDGVAAWTAISEAVSSERGRFFIDREGRAVFYNRHHTMTEPTISATLTDDMRDLRYVYGDTVSNELTVNVRPRRVGLPDDIVWTLASPQRIPAGRVQTLRAVYHRADGQPTGALDVAHPLPYTHYTATQTANPASADRTTALEIITQTTAANATLRIRNISAGDVYLQELTLRGTPLQSGDPVALILSDAVGIALYGLRPSRVDLPQVSSVEEAERIGLYELNRRKTPRGRVVAVTLWTASHPAALDITLFDRVRIEEAQTGHAAEYLVIGEAHTVQRGGTRHHIEWTLEPADDDVYFVVDRASVGGDRLILPF